MTTPKNGGPAFPAGIVRKSRPAHDPGADFYVTDFTEPRNAGMTLRDYFAAKAMQGMLANPNQDYAPLTIRAQEAVVAGAYEMADAMLKAREAA